MLEFIALAVVIAAVYGLAAFGTLKTDQPVVVPSPARARRRQGRR